MKVPEGYVAFVEELPGVNTQGATLDEAREKLREAVSLVLEANRVLAEESLAGREVIKESSNACMKSAVCRRRVAPRGSRALRRLGDGSDHELVEQRHGERHLPVPGA